MSTNDVPVDVDVGSVIFLIGSSLSQMIHNRRSHIQWELCGNKMFIRAHDAPTLARCDL